MKKPNTSILIDCFESTAGLQGKSRRSYHAVKDCVLKAGRYSIFEATANAQAIRLFSSLEDDPELEVDHTLGYPWIGIRLKKKK